MSSSGFSSPLLSPQFTALAIDTAEQIAATGVSLLGAPQPIYDNSQVSPPGVPGLVGATVSNHWFPAPVPTEAQAITLFNGYLGTPLGNQVQRVYYGEGAYPSLTDQPLAACIAAGAKIQLCLKPLRTGLGSSTIAASEKANITAAINLIQGAGADVDVVLWTEHNLGSAFTGATQYQQYITTYGPTVRAGGTGGPVKLLYNPASYNMATAQSYYPGDASFDAVTFDWYGTDSKNNINPFANLTWTSLPVGLSEWNAVAAAGDTLSNQQWLTYTGQIISYFSARLANGETNWDIILYTGYNASPLNQILSATDWKIPQILAVYEALSSVPPVTPGITVSAGATRTVPPINPTSGGGYAIASGLSYDITLNLIAEAAGSTDPFVTIQFNWYNTDSAGAMPIEIAHWHLPVGETGTAGANITGTGPQFGKYLQIKVANNDTETCTVTLQVNSTSRAAALDKWYWDALNSVNIPTFTESGNGGSFSNQLISVNGISVPASPGSVSYLMSMWTGQVFVSCSTGGTSPLQFQIIPQPVSKMGGGAVYDESTTSDARMICLPRAPCLLVINNPGGSAETAYVQVIPNN